MRRHGSFTGNTVPGLECLKDRNVLLHVVARDKRDRKPIPPHEEVRASHKDRLKESSVSGRFGDEQVEGGIRVPELLQALAPGHLIHTSLETDKARLGDPSRRKPGGKRLDQATELDDLNQLL